MRPFAQVDVFTDVPGLGNPVAVVLDATGLATADMARFAAWTNLSETTFVLPPEGSGDYRVRIFTPSTELPFAGHPTLGTCRALLDAGLVTPRDGRVVQECAAGEVVLDVGDGTVSFTAPRADVLSEPGGIGDLRAALGGVVVHDPLLLDVGPRWLTARVAPAELADLRPDPVALPALFAQHGWDLTLYAIDGDGVSVRSLFAAGGLVEDPVCGSGNVAVAAHLRATGALAALPRPYVARQGRHRGRDGRVVVDASASAIRVGGAAVTVISGTVAVAGVAAVSGEDWRA
jgi:PhzF family phenazine biosynthesis protein